MAWYWWLLIAVVLFGIIGAICSDDYDEEEGSTSDTMNRLAALVIIDGLKAADFDKACDILKECGFGYYCVFQNRIPEYLKL